MKKKDKELKLILRIARKRLKRKDYKKIKQLEDISEVKHLMKYAVISSFEKEYYNLEKIIDDMEKKSKDVFFAKNLVMILPSKIKFLKAHFIKEEFNKVISLIKAIKKELKNV